MILLITSIIALLFAQKWYGFNPGSTLMISNSGSAAVCALAAVTTTIAAASGSVFDAVPVHFGNGMWGCIAVGLFVEPSRVINAYGEHGNYGLVYGTGANLLGAQVVGVLWIMAWVTVIMTPYFMLLNAAGMFRVDAIEEEVGLDISHHKGAAYDLTAPDATTVEKFEISRSTRKLEIPVEAPAPSPVVPVAPPAPAAEEDAA